MVRRLVGEGSVMGIEKRRGDTTRTLLKGFARKSMEKNVLVETVQRKLERSCKDGRKRF